MYPLSRDAQLVGYLRLREALPHHSAHIVHLRGVLNKPVARASPLHVVSFEGGVYQSL